MPFFHIMDGAKMSMLIWNCLLWAVAKSAEDVCLANGIKRQATSRATNEALSGDLFSRIQLPAYEIESMDHWRWGYEIKLTGMKVSRHIDRQYSLLRQAVVGVCNIYSAFFNEHVPEEKKPFYANVINKFATSALCNPIMRFQILQLASQIQDIWLQNHPSYFCNVNASPTAADPHSGEGDSAAGRIRPEDTRRFQPWELFSARALKVMEQHGHEILLMHACICARSLSESQEETAAVDRLEEQVIQRASSPFYRQYKREAKEQMKQLKKIYRKTFREANLHSRLEWYEFACNDLSTNYAMEFRQIAQSISMLPLLWDGVRYVNLHVVRNAFPIEQREIWSDEMRANYGSELYPSGYTGETSHHQPWTKMDRLPRMCNANFGYSYEWIMNHISSGLHMARLEDAQDLFRERRQSHNRQPITLEQRGTTPVTQATRQNPEPLSRARVRAVPI